MPDDEVVKHEVKHPVEHHIGASTRSVSEDLNVDEPFERRVEGVDDCDYESVECVHCVLMLRRLKKYRLFVSLKRKSYFCVLQTSAKIILFANNLHLVSSVKLN